MLGGAGDGRPAIDTDAKMAEAILALSATTNGRLAVQGFRQLERRTGTRARRPRRGQRGEADHLRRHPGPAGSGDHQPGVVGQRDRRAPLRPVHRQRRAASSPGTPSPGGCTSCSTTTGCTRWARPCRSTGCRWTCTGCSASRRSASGRGRRVGDRALPDPALEVVDPLRVPGQPVHAVALPRRTGGVDERAGRRRDRGARQRLGRGGQPQRRDGAARDRQPPDARRAPCSSTTPRSGW